MTTLKKVFEEVRKTKEVEQVLPYFLPSSFYAVGIVNSGGTFDFALSKSPTGDGYCVTVSDDVGRVTFPQWNTMEFHGKQLLELIPENVGVLISYADGGGDFLLPNSKFSFFLK